jgi:hypothetical protein
VDVQSHERGKLHVARLLCLRLGAGQFGATLDHGIPKTGPSAQSANLGFSRPGQTVQLRYEPRCDVLRVGDQLELPRPASSTTSLAREPTQVAPGLQF